MIDNIGNEQQFRQTVTQLQAGAARSCTCSCYCQCPTCWCVPDFWNVYAHRDQNSNAGAFIVAHNEGQYEAYQVA